MEIQVVYNVRGAQNILIRFKRDVFLSKLEHYFKGDIGLLTEAFNMMEKDLKKEILKL